MGFEAAINCFRFRCTFFASGGLWVFLLAMAGVSGLAGILSVAYAAFAFILVIALPLMVYSGFPLNHASKLIKAKYGISDPKSVRLPLPALAREDQFDQWVFMNRQDGRN